MKIAAREMNLLGLTLGVLLLALTYLGLEPKIREWSEFRAARDELQVRRDEARDMVQEAWVEILRGLARLDDVAAFPAWAYRIVTRRCHRFYKKSSREPLESEEAGEGVAIESPEIEGAELAVDAARVMAAIAELPAPQRAALALFYTEDLSVAEIAVALDVPPGTVKTRLMHARRKVRAILGG